MEALYETAKKPTKKGVRTIASPSLKDFFDLNSSLFDAKEPLYRSTAIQ